MKKKQHPERKRKTKPSPKKMFTEVSFKPDWEDIRDAEWLDINYGDTGNRVKFAGPGWYILRPPPSYESVFILVTGPIRVSNMYRRDSTMYRYSMFTKDPRPAFRLIADAKVRKDDRCLIRKISVHIRLNNRLAT